MIYCWFNPGTRHGKRYSLGIWSLLLFVDQRFPSKFGSEVSELYIYIYIYLYIYIYIKNE